MFKATMLMEKALSEFRHDLATNLVHFPQTIGGETLDLAMPEPEFRKSTFNCLRFVKEIDRARAERAAADAGTRHVVPFRRA
jgi:hypothetical protein